MMNSQIIREHAILLDEAIARNVGSHADVDFLASYTPLREAIEDAKRGGISAPRDLGLSRWELESNIRDMEEVSHRLAQFELLLEGCTLVGGNRD